MDDYDFEKIDLDSIINEAYDRESLIEKNRKISELKKSYNRTFDNMIRGNKNQIKLQNNEDRFERNANRIIYGIYALLIYIAISNGTDDLYNRERDPFGRIMKYTSNISSIFYSKEDKPLYQKWVSDTIRKLNK